MRACGILNLALGIPLILIIVGAAVGALVKWFAGDLTSVSFDTAKLGIVAGLGGLIALWAGQAMAFSRVKLSRKWLSAGGGLMLHRWHRGEILAIDIRRHDFGRAKRTVPVVVLHNGKSFPLNALASASPGSAGLPPAASGESQQSAVDELRAALGVGGSAP